MLLSLASNMTSLGAPIMIVNATSMIVANATLLTDVNIQQTLAYVWVVFLSILLGCIIVTTVLGKYSRISRIRRKSSRAKYRK